MHNEDESLAQRRGLEEDEEEEEEEEEVSRRRIVVDRLWIGRSKKRETAWRTVILPHHVVWSDPSGDVSQIPTD